MLVSAVALAQTLRPALLRLGLCRLVLDLAGRGEKNMMYSFGPWYSPYRAVRRAQHYVPKRQQRFSIW